MSSATIKHALLPDTESMLITAGDRVSWRLPLAGYRRCFGTVFEVVPRAYRVRGDDGVYRRIQREVG